MTARALRSHLALALDRGTGESIEAQHLGSTGEGRFTDLTPPPGPLPHIINSVSLLHRAWESPKETEKMHEKQVFCRQAGRCSCHTTGTGPGEMEAEGRGGSGQRREAS